MALGLIKIVIIYATFAINGMDYINDGERKLKEGKFEEAIILFNKAISSDLSYIGNAICYWNIFIAYDQLKKDDGAAEALMAFKNTILLFEDELKSYKSNHPGFAIMTRYRIHSKIKYANTLLDIYWMKKAPYNCRTKLFSCNIPDIKYVAVYNNKLPFCADNSIKDISVSPLNNMFEVDIKCQNLTLEKYYFEVIDEKRISSSKGN